MFECVTDQNITIAAFGESLVSSAVKCIRKRSKQQGDWNPGRSMILRTLALDLALQKIVYYAIPFEAKSFSMASCAGYWS